MDALFGSPQKKIAGISYEELFFCNLTSVDQIVLDSESVVQRGFSCKDMQYLQCDKMYELHYFLFCYDFLPRSLFFVVLADTSI